MIKLYGAGWCNPCQNVKKFLEDNNIAYDYCDIDSEVNMEALQELGVRSVPVLLKENGDWRCTSDINQIKKFLEV